MKNNLKWQIKDVIILALLAFLFGGIFTGAGALYVVIEALLTPYGLAPFANEILFGLWTLAAPITAVILRKSGSAVLGEVLAALAEMLYGSYFGAGVLISGFIQGLGSELGFAVTRYKSYKLSNLIYSGIGITAFSFIFEFFKLGYTEYSTGMIFSLLGVRFLSVMVFNVLLVQGIMKLHNEIQATAGTDKKN